MPSCVIPTMSPSLFQCLHSTHIVATIAFQTIFSNQILSVGVGLNSVCYSIPLYTIKPSVAVDMNFEPQKLKYCNIKGLWVFIYKQIVRQSSKMFRKNSFAGFPSIWLNISKFVEGRKIFLSRMFIFLPISPPQMSVPLPFPQSRPCYYAMSKNVSIWCYRYFCRVLKQGEKNS
jgi:hypothetical protein